MSGRAVVITGASSGIGMAAAQHLRSEGFEVFAGVRKQADADRLAELGMHPLLIDVTAGESIAGAAAQVRDSVGAAGLSGLVNNAGIAVSGPLEFLPLERLREQLEVNLVGQVAVIQAFLPLLRLARGRIVNVSSIAGRVALPMMSPYSASKYALEGVSDSLRRELRGQGVKVSLVEPGGVKTPIWEKGVATANEIEAQAPPEAHELYGRTIKAARAQAHKIDTKTGIDPADVAERIAHALTSRRPRTRYLVGRDAKTRMAAAKILPTRWFDALVARALR